MSSFANAEPVTIGYWSIRGLAAPLRMMVMYAGCPLNNVMCDLKLDKEGKVDASEWFSKKPELKQLNPLINLPYVIDGDIIISQSNACFTYLGRKFDMLGSTPIELIKCEELLFEIMDLRNKMVEFSYSWKSIDNSVPLQLLQNICSSNNGILQKLELTLQYNEKNCIDGCFLVGNKVSAPDFHLYELLLQYDSLATYIQAETIFKNFPYLLKFYNNFSKLPQNQKYLMSNIGQVSPVLTIPFNNKMAGFGADVSGGRWNSDVDYEFNTYVGLY